jgi:GAF domain-containing protein
MPKNEKERVTALESYGIMDTPPEQEFDDITQLASYICGTPIAMISLVAPNRQWFKSKVGTTLSETRRDLAFCAHAIMERDLFMVKDASKDPRFSHNPLVQTDPNIRFYAGMPLVTREDCALGTLCVVDHEPRELTPEQQEALRALSRLVMAQLEYRRKLARVASNP